MKTSPLLLIATLFFVTADSARAEGPRGFAPDFESGGRGNRHRRVSAQPVPGLQPASGLQTSGPLNGASLSVRLSEEDWRKVFVRKEAQK